MHDADGMYPNVRSSDVNILQYRRYHGLLQRDEIVAPKVQFFPAQTVVGEEQWVL